MQTWNNLLEKLAQKSKGEFAPGIPANKAKAPIPGVPRYGKPVTWWYVDHKHEAVKSGLHSDLRLSDGKRAYSWAVKKGIPQKPGEKVLAVRQPDHDPGYMFFQGQLPTGYGRTKGRGVWVNDTGPARILQATDDKVHFALIHPQNPQQFTMVKTKGDDWLLINTTPTPGTRPGVPQSKPNYREAKPEEFEKFLSNGAKNAITSKIDGAHVSINFDRKTPEVYSYRPRERNTGLLDHTFLSGLERVKTPEALQGVRIRGELYAVDKDGKAIPARELGGIMNSSPQKGRNALEGRDYKIRFGVFDVVSGPKGKPMEGAPWGEKLEVLKQVTSKMKPFGFHLPEIALTPEKQKALFAKIRDKKDPLTDEGVVVWPLEQSGPPTKIKFRPHHQVYIHEIVEGSGKYTGTMGSYTYSVAPGGPPVGFVGTGFTDDQRDWMWKHRNDLRGRKAVILSSEQFPSGAYRAPSHSHLHD